MAAWSALKQLFSRTTVNNILARRSMSEHRTFPLVPSRFQWGKFKDLLHFYTLLGIIPVGAVLFYTNVFIGPATLSEIPEGYVPKHWEYYNHPVTRFIARYIAYSPQESYEKYMHYVFEEEEKRKLKILEKEIKNKVKERGDYQMYYYRPVLGKYHRVVKETADHLSEIQGD